MKWLKENLKNFTSTFKSVRRTSGQGGSKNKAPLYGVSDESSYESAMRIALCFVICSMLCILSMLCNGFAEAAEIPSAQAVRAIVGEVEGEPYIGKIAVGEAIRNRGSLKGVYGLNRNLSGVSSRTWKEAERAWQASADTNYVKSADGWGNDKDIEKFKEEGWWSDSLIVKKIGAHTFYRGRKNAGKVKK